MELPIHIFTDKELNKLSQLFKILSHVSRLKILRALFDGDKYVSEIIKLSGLGQSNVSKQLKFMEAEGVISSTQLGTLRFYKLESQLIADIFNLIDQSKLRINK